MCKLTKIKMISWEEELVTVYYMVYKEGVLWFIIEAIN
jgi:hypothetical protein